MKTFFHKLACVLLIMAMLTSFACVKKPKPGPTPEPQPTETATEAPTGDPTEEPTPAATNAPAEKSDADIEFEKIADELFISAVTSDGLTFHQLVVDPADFGIEESDVERGWGEMSYEANLADYEDNDELLERLGAIDKQKLLPENRLAYENLFEAIELSNELRDFYYYDEPLTPFNGEHTMLPLMMTMYEIASREDAENYLLLLEDMPRYIRQLIQFENEKAAAGLFMTENALDQVLESLEKTIGEGEDYFLIDSFEEALDNSGVDFSAEERQTLTERNRSAVLNGVLSAFSELKSALEALRNSCREPLTTRGRSEEEKRYFEAKVKNESAIRMESKTMANMLNALAQDHLMELYNIMMGDPSAMNAFQEDITSGDPEKDTEYLLEVIENLYPKIPDQKIDFVDIPDAVADDFSPAAYMISAFDDPSRNIVMFNPTADKSTLLLTLAHECFPGHLYQTQYFRNSSIPRVQQVMAPTGYLEGWAVFSEFMIASKAEKYNSNGVLLAHYNATITNILIPAYCSIRINTEAWTKDDVSNYLSYFGLNQNEYVDIIYEYAADVPTYFFNYAMGYANTYKIYKKVAPKTDEQKLAFISEYLSYGPCFFDILNEKFGI